MYKRIVWTLGGLAVVLWGLVLLRVMPHQAWGVRDALGDWSLATQTWALLWRGWPLVGVGVLVGFGGASVWFVPGLKRACEADFQRALGELLRERD